MRVLEQLAEKAAAWASAFDGEDHDVSEVRLEARFSNAEGCSWWAAVGSNPPAFMGSNPIGALQALVAWQKRHGVEQLEQRVRRSVTTAGAERCREVLENLIGDCDDPDAVVVGKLDDLEVQDHLFDLMLDRADPAGTVSHCALVSS